MGPRTRLCSAQRQAAGRSAWSVRGRGRLPAAPRRRGLGPGVTVRFFGVSGLRVRRGGSMAGAEGSAPQVSGGAPGPRVPAGRLLLCRPLGFKWSHSLPAFFKTRILRFPVAASGVERLKGAPMRTHTEKLTAAAIGEGNGDMADRRWNQPMDTWRIKRGGDFPSACL